MRFAFFIFLFSLTYYSSNAQSDSVAWWHNEVRTIHYKPEGTDFVCVNPTRRFNRALYGTNTAFRVEAGDLPEFAMYMPGMGGNFKFGIVKGMESKWLTDAKNIKAVYRPGSMLYEIKDPLLGNGVIHISILALADAEGMIIKTNIIDVDKQTELIWVFGGASGKKFSRDGDIGADPESSFYLQPGYCKDNNYQLSKNKFLLSYGAGKVLSEEERYEVNHLEQTRKDSVADKKYSLKFLSGVFPPSSFIRIADANQQQNPLQLYQSDSSAEPVITGKIATSDSVNYVLIENTNSLKINYNDLSEVFNKAEAARKK